MFLLSIAERFVLYNFSKRPIPGQSNSNKMIFVFASLGPLFYSVGWHLFTDFKKDSKWFLYSEIILIILSILFFVYTVWFFFYGETKTPLSKIRKSTYEEDRPFFDTEYEQTYPLTKRIAKLNFQQNIKEKIQKIQK